MENQKYSNPFKIGHVILALIFTVATLFSPFNYCVAASSSTIAINVKAYYDAEDGDVVWSVSNSGDALADRISLSLKADNSDIIVSETFFLDGGDEYSGRLHTPFLKENKRGKYILPLYVKYEDGLGNAYSTIAWVRHWIDEDPKAFSEPVQTSLAAPDEHEFIVVEKGVPGGKGTISLMAMSFIDEDIIAHPRFLLPSGIELEGDAPREFKIPAQGISHLEVTVTNQAINKSGAYPVAAILEFTDSSGVRHSVDSSTYLRIESGVDDAHLVRMPQKMPVSVFYIVFSIWALLFILRWRRGYPATRGLPEKFFRWIDFAIVSGCTIYLGWLLNIHLVFLDTLCVGGDTPAHHYLVSHMGRTGKIVSWAPGWWSGFPMFRYYFPLPYIVMATLSRLFAHNVVFKICSVAGIMVLPLSFYLSGKILRLPRPAPAILACLSIPIALDNTHSMWGVNAYSTLAGMIANSWSFAFMLPAISSACRDALDNHFRWRTVVLLSAMVLSHFFTSMMAAGVLFVLMCVLVIRESMDSVPLRKCGWFVLFREGICVLLFCSWWLFPLVVLRNWSVDFGVPWKINFFKQLPPTLPPSFAGSLICGAIALFFVRREKQDKVNVESRILMFIHVTMLAAALLLFYGGGFLVEVFVNCRFWPFITYSLLVISALAFSYASRVADIPLAGTIAALSFCAAFAWRTGGNPVNPAWSNENHVSFWSQANFRGMEAMPEGYVMYEIAEAVRGTPGRMSNDLHVGNEYFGSSRVFEAMPFLADKPILEGGIVNSALGSLTAYAVQGEVSDSTAGFPLIVKPRSFAPESGLRHLEFMNVRQFVARSRRVQEAFMNDEGWQLKDEFGGGKWKLFESTIESASPVRIWNTELPVYRSENLQADLLEWFYEIGAVKTPAILLSDGDEPPPGTEVKTHEEFVAMLAAAHGNAAPAAGWLDEVSRTCEEAVVSDDGSIRFVTDSIGEPHLIAVSYFPDLRVRGADRIYFVTPGYLIVFPTQSEVEVYYGKGFAVIAGEALFLAGLLIMAISKGVLPFQRVALSTLKGAYRQTSQSAS
jgi:hypothetical protein